MLTKAKCIAPTYSTIVNQLSSELENLAFLPHPNTPFPSTANLHTETQTNPVEYTDEDTSSSQSRHTYPTHTEISTSFSIIPPPVCIYDALSLSNDKLCFIQYTPDGTIIHRWYPSDAGKSDDSSRWWSDWYRYSQDSITDNVIFGDRVHFRPNITPNHSKYSQGGDSVNLKQGTCLPLDPFDFESLYPTNRTS
mmetsp:Transcript_30633/g.36414  ORF Transcript_30633/g.36414 Transcript_30633/m.36414 type:complete len:194 (+) Transcript_30633:253-834(+)